MVYPDTRLRSTRKYQRGEILKEKSINAGKQNKMGFFWVNYWVWAVEQQKAQPINQTTKSITYKSKCEPTYITKRKL